MNETKNIMSNKKICLYIIHPDYSDVKIIKGVLYFYSVGCKSESGTGSRSIEKSIRY